MKKFLKIGCLGFSGLLLLLFLALYFTRDERKAENKEMRDSINYFRTAINHRMLQVKKSLSMLDNAAKPKPFPAGPIPWEVTLQTSVEEVSRFTDTGFVAEPPISYGPWLTDILYILEKSYTTDTTQWNLYELVKATRTIYREKYLMVYDPMAHAQPKFIDENRFTGGSFLGRMIFVDFTSGELLGYSYLFSRTTLKTIEKHQLGVGVEVVKIPVYTIPLVNITDSEKILLEDFRNEFFRKSDSTFQAFKVKGSQ